MSSSPSQDLEVLTVGHSNHPIEQFIKLLRKQGVTALADVRSAPYSRWHSQFDREVLCHQLRAVGIEYAFLGRELGARSEDPDCYDGDRVVYSKIAQTDLFKQGLRRVREGAKSYRLALMCAEKDPLECHRSILVARELEALGVKVYHILHDGELQSHVDAMRNLLAREGLHQGQFHFSAEGTPGAPSFSKGAAPLDEAYRKREEKIAYRQKPEEPSPRP